MPNTKAVSNLRNKLDETEKVLDEADFEANNNTKRLTRIDVFSKIMKKINSLRIRSE